MTNKLENLENNMAKLTIEVDLAKFEEGLTYSFNKNRNHFKIDGFRNGKAPRNLIEKMYGVEVLYEDAVNYVLPESYENAIKEHKLEVVSRPDIDIVQIGRDKNLVYTAMVTLKPEVTLGSYKGIEVEKIDIEVKEEDVMQELKKIAESNSRLVSVSDRPAKMGDIVTIDFEGFVDDVAFEGGKAEDYELELGSRSFIDTFEDQLVGTKVGDSLDVKVTFPEEYHSKELAGKLAIFKVTIKDITEKQLPEIDDSFAQDVSEFETLDEYKKDIRAKLENEKVNSAKAEKENRAIKKVVDGSKMDVPEVMVANQVEKLLHNFAMRMKQNGLTLEQYVQYTGQSVASIRESLKDEALEQVKVSLMLDAIVNAEKITVSEEEFNAKVEEIANSMKFDVSLVKNGLVGEKREEFEDEIKLQKAVDLIVSNAVEK